MKLSDKKYGGLNNSASQSSISTQISFGIKRKISLSQLETNEKMSIALELFINKNSGPEFEG